MDNKQTVTTKPIEKRNNYQNQSPGKNKNPYNVVQRSTNSYVYHQHAYDISAYAQMVSNGKTPEEAISALEFFYKNIFRLDGAENK